MATMEDFISSASRSSRSNLQELEDLSQKIEIGIEMVSFTQRRAAGSEPTTTKAAEVHEPGSAANATSKETSAFSPGTSDAQEHQLLESSLSVSSLPSSHSNKILECHKFQCPACPLSFRGRINLEIHAQVHTPRGGHNPKCRQCEAWFDHPVGLRAHEKWAHGIVRSGVVKKRTEDYSVSSRSSTISGPSTIVSRHKAKSTGGSKNIEQHFPSVPPPPAPSAVTVAQNAVVVVNVDDECKERHSSTSVSRCDKNISTAAQHTLQSNVQNDAKIYNKITTFINLCSDQIKSANLSARSGNSSDVNDGTCDSDDAKRAAIYEILTHHVEAPLRRALLRVGKHDDEDEVAYEKVIYQMPTEKNLTALDLISDLEVLKNSCTLLAAQRMRPMILRACLIQALAVVQAIENAIRPTPLVAAKLE